MLGGTGILDHAHGLIEKCLANASILLFSEKLVVFGDEVVGYPTSSAQEA